MNIHEKFNGKDTDEKIFNEMADVLNTIDIYMHSIGRDISELDEYRLKQVQKHLN